MQEIEKLIEVLEGRVEQNGPEKTLTLGLFLKILKDVRHRQEMDFLRFIAGTDGNCHDDDF